MSPDVVQVSLLQVAFSEVLGTTVLIVLGVGVVANVLLPQTKGHDGGWLLINFGWGIGVFSGVYLAVASGAHLNPAVTMGLLTSGAAEYAPGVAITPGSTAVYLVSTVAGAVLGAVLAWLAHKRHYDLAEDQGAILGTFATGPAIRSPLWNLVTEIIATFVLIAVILSFDKTPSEIGPLAVALLVVGIGASLGGPTGYAINPARDLGPRIAHAVLPIPGKGSSDWGYAWVPILGPLLGAALAGGLIRAMG